MLKTSLLVCTYNWPEALELVLKSILNQAQLPDEVLIVDDGSTEDTKNLVAKYQSNFPVPLHHVWHPDDGFRKTIILNEAIAKAKGDYIIQMDGDCVCHSSFVKDHIDFASKGSFGQGSRVFMNPERSELALQNFNFSIPFYSKGIVNRLNAIHAPFMRKMMDKPSTSLAGTRGCNVAFWKSDLIQVNGYNEAIQGWGREDTELAVRLMNSGISKRKLKFGAIQYHIHHEDNSRGKLASNHGILETAIAEKWTRCEDGLNLHLEN